MKFRTHSLFRLICTVLTAALLTGSVFAVSTTDKAFAAADTVYVAGCPDGYPVEYYNEATGCFEGIMPKLLERVAADTGLTFTYLRGGESDQRVRMAKNGQVQLVSCVKASETELIEQLKAAGAELFRVEVDGTETACFVGFTQAASEELIQTVNAALAGVSDEALLTISIRAAGAGPQKRSSGALTLVFAALSAVLVAVLLRMRRRWRQKEAEPVDSFGVKNILSLSDFQEYFNKNVGDESRAVYVISYLSFDVHSLAKNYGISSVGHQLNLSAGEVLKHKEPQDLLTMDESGLILARVSGGNESTEDWVRGILEKLNSGVSTTSHLYFRAGIYRLNRLDNNCAEAIANAHQSCLAAAQQCDDVYFCTSALLKQVAERRQLADDSVEAFERNEFKLYLQMTVDAGTGNIVGAEALTRWEHPTRGLLHPGIFLPSLAECGAVQKMDYYMFDQVCSQLEQWQKQGVDLYISCNFARNSIDDPTFADQILERAGKYAFDHSKLVIEITEDIIESNRALALQNIMACHDAGFRIALDDLGAGVTSFSDLRDYPLDMVKIDRSILLMAESARGKALLGALIHMAQELGIDTLCEGVENVQQAEMLKAMNCHIIQGYYFFRPMPAEVVCDYLRKQD